MPMDSISDFSTSSLSVYITPARKNIKIIYFV